MLQFQGFKPDALNRMAKTMGYSGDMGEFNKFLNENPEKQEMMDVYSEKAKEMMMGGYVKGYANGGVVQGNIGYFRMPDGRVATDNLTRADKSIGPRDMGTPISFAEYQQGTPVGTLAAPSGSMAPPLIQQPFDPRLQQPVQRNPNIEAGYYDSPEFQESQRPQAGTRDVRYSPYFGRRGSGSASGAEDRGYEAYLNRTGNTGYLQGGADFNMAEGYRPDTFAYVGPDGKIMEGLQGQIVDPRTGLATTPTMGTEPYTPSSAMQQMSNRSAAQTTGQAANPQATAPVGPVDYTQGPVPQSTGYQGQTITDATTQRAFSPAMPYGTTVQPVGTAFNANQEVGSSVGQVTGTIGSQTAGAVTSTAATPTAIDPRTMTATTTQAGVQAATGSMAPAQGAVDPRAQVTGQQTTETSVEALTEAQGTATTMSNPVTRTIQAGEVVSGAANAQTAATFMEQVQAAEATPTNKATVQGQLEGLMASFEGGNTPAWAAGAMRNVTTQMANRGLGASSMAAQALIQGAMESALPIAQADAQIIAQFEAQNLSNRQQRAMLAAQQRATFMGMEFDQSFQARVQNSARIGDIANMNFTADQQIALENSRIANTVNLANLSNSQAMVMAEAAALSQLDMANLSNRQQASVMNAQSFMQMDMANLSNKQQTEMFSAQSRIQSLFTDQAAENAARQFNATSQSQTDQFFASLANSTSQFNATQANAQGQFNAGQTNAMSQFIDGIKNQRDMYNANNKLVIEQNNAQWRREIATADTVAINRANEINATNLLNISNTAYQNLWAYYDDSMEWAWTSTENERNRMNTLAERQLINDGAYAEADLKGDQQAAIGFGDLIGQFFTGGSSILSGLSGR